MEQLENNLGVLNVTCFSNEAYFHLDGYINKETFSLITNTFWAIVQDVILLLKRTKFPKCEERSMKVHTIAINNKTVMNF
jgi:hypothetical protein